MGIHMMPPLFVEVMKPKPTVWVRVILEPWTVDTSPPDFARIILEEWTEDTSPPDFTRVILEPWTS